MKRQHKQHKQHALVSAVLAACLGLTAGAAQAAGAPDTNTITQASADLNFSTQTGFRHVLIPTQGYFAGTVADQQILANGSVDSGTGAPTVYGVRFAPGGNFTPDTTQPSASYYYTGTVTGTTDGAHALKVRLYTRTFNCSTPIREADGWIHCATATISSAGYLIDAPAAQSVAADTYTVSMQAAAWVS